MSIINTKHSQPLGIFPFAINEWGIVFRPQLDNNRYVAILVNDKYLSTRDYLQILA